MVIHKLFLINIYRKSVTVYNTCFHRHKYKTVTESIHCFKTHFVTEQIANIIMKIVRRHIIVAGKSNDFKLEISLLMKELIEEMCYYISLCILE
jgi:hypothetical protein